MTNIDVLSLGTVTAFLAFLGICWWAYDPRNRRRFERDAEQAIEDDLYSDRPVPPATDKRD